MRVLVVNAGSSSMKVDIIDGGRSVESFDALPTDAPAVDAVGHRIVHGGPAFHRPVIVDDDVEAQLRQLVDLAPLHQPKSLDAFDAARRLLPDVPHVACFDTAFHATLPPEAYTYAVPREWREKWGVRRYGFHGLSHAWAARRAQEMAPGCRRVVTCHLGAGASLTAVLDGRSVDTTMGFTPLEGLVMATRSGSIDPGMVLWIEEKLGLAPHQMTDTLEHRSGLLGLAGTSDMRDLLTRDDADARLAVQVYVHRLAKELTGLTSTLGGLDTVVFTGGVGEHSRQIRQLVGAKLAHLGVLIEASANDGAEPDTDVSAIGAGVRTLVVTSREDLEIAHGVEQAVHAS